MMSAPGRADTFEFVLGANNLFSSENNWSPAGGPPGPNDVAEFTADAVYNVNFQDSPTNFWLRVHNGEVTFRPVGLPADVLRTYSVTSAEIDGGSLIMTGNQARRIAVNNTSDGNMNVGMSQSGSLTITEGATLESSVVALGTFASGQGAITVSGEGSQWVNNSSIFVGVQGRGELTVAEGAAFTNNVTLVIGQLTDSFGQVTLSESSVSSQGLLVGQSGIGTLTITEGANLESLTATLGSSAGSQGTVTVTGAGSTWISQSSLRLAGSTSPGGSALLTIANGGLVETAGQLRLFPQATATIDGGTLRVGSFDKQGGVLDWIDGTLHVTGDAGLTVGNGPFADFLALSSSQHLIVDHQLAVEPGAVFLARSPLTTGSLANNGALILYNNLVSADDLTNNGNLILEGNTVDGPVTNAADGTITVFGEVTFNDLVDGPGGFYGPGTTVFTGGYTPGASPATVPFEGSVRFSDSNTLTIELAGLTPGDEHDQLFIGGDAMLDGSLLVELLDGFTPGFNQQFTILDVAGTLTGQFAGLDEGALVGTFGGTDLFITYAAGDGNNVALFTPGLPGDFNNDGVVDAADYTVWRDGLGAEFDAADYDDWQNNFGATAPPGSGASQLAAVPEPTSAALVVCALIASFTVLAKRRS